MSETSNSDGQNALIPSRNGKPATAKKKKVSIEEAERNADLIGLPEGSAAKAKAHAVFGEWVTHLGTIRVSRGRLNWSLEATESAIKQLDEMMPTFEKESMKVAAMRCKGSLLQTQVDALKTMISSASKDIVQPDEAPERARSFPPGATVIAQNAQVLVGNTDKPPDKA